jgi:hypothetical protein
MTSVVFFFVLGLTALGALGMLNVTTASLIGLGFMLQMRQDIWQVGGVLFDSFDLALGFIAVAIVVRGLPRGSSLKKSIPRLGVWLCLAAFLSAAYAVSPSGQQNMTDPIRIVYQLYRYAIRFAVLYPIACLLLNTPRKFDQVLTGIVVAADICALMSLRQGYGGDMATGPFSTKNVLGSVLAVPAVLVFADILRGRHSPFVLLSAALLARSALFAASRGAFAGILVGTATAWWFMYHGRVRTRLVALTLAGTLAVTLGIVVKPDLMQRPTIAQFFTTFDPGQDTLSWRIHERWPHFARRAMQRPWLGWGTDLDETLGPRANTSHNGYLALANNFGLPVLGFYLLFSIVALRDAWRVSWRGRDPDDRIRAAKIGGGLACILTHNLVDSVIMLPFAGGELWIFAAVAASLAARVSHARAERAPAASPRPAFALGAGS